MSDDLKLGFAVRWAAEPAARASVFAEKAGANEFFVFRLLLCTLNEAAGVEKCGLHRQAHGIASHQSIQSLDLNALAKEKVRENADNGKATDDEKTKFEFGKTVFCPYSHVLILWRAKRSPQVPSSGRSGSPIMDGDPRYP